MRPLPRILPTLRKPILGAAALLTLALPAPATWSIVVADRATGEVCVATATCLANFDLQRYVPMIVVGEGGAAAQSSIDIQAVNRRRIRDGLRRGIPPHAILNYLVNVIGNQTNRQYGIVSLSAGPVTYSGPACGVWFGGLTGTAGTVSYAIQGNVLTGLPVITAAETALLNTQGDLATRVMAAMEAARSMGGDGRCSCSQSAPDSCGAPPANFAQSAQVACIILARMGDTDGVCSGAWGCVSGSYYMKLQFSGNASTPDPVIMLQGQYDAFRQSMQGRPDHLRSTLHANAHRLPADGLTSTRVRVELNDLDGTPLTTGGATLTGATVDGDVPNASMGAVTDHGDGSYSFDLTAGTTPGNDTWQILVDDGGGPITLYPFLELKVDPASPLHVGANRVSSSNPAPVPFVLNDAASPGRPYLLLGSGSGTVPGQTFGNLTLPLNRDPFFLITRTQAGGPLLPGTQGSLDGTGRAQASFVPPAGFLAPYVGSRLDWAVLVFAPSGNSVLGPVGFEVLP